MQARGVGTILTSTAKREHWYANSGRSFAPSRKGIPIVGDLGTIGERNPAPVLQLTAVTLVEIAIHSVSRRYSPEICLLL